MFLDYSNVYDIPLQSFYEWVFIYKYNQNKYSSKAKIKLK